MPMIPSLCVALAGARPNEKLVISDRYQQPWGTVARLRSPCDARPRGLAIFVDAAVIVDEDQSRGVEGKLVVESRYATARDIGRCCSEACAVFSEHNASAIEESQTVERAASTLR
nr:hypothetical protein SHINE37_60035 [Rhizobiaceae bacterium]